MSTTVTGTSGNDTLYGTSESNVFQYASGDGNDVIRNFSGEDVLKITSGSINSYSISGGDLIFNIGSGSVTLKNMANHYVSVQASDGSTTYNRYTNGTTQLAVIQTFVQAMQNSSSSNATTMLNEAVQASTNFNSMSDALNQFVSDCQSAGSSDIFLRDYCGIDLDNEDTGAITGWDAGGRTILTAESVVPESGSSTSPSGGSFTRNGLTITYSSNLSSAQEILRDGLYTWWLGNSLSLINRSYGLSFQSGSPSYSTMDLNFFNDSTGALAYVESYGYEGDRYASSASLYINTYYYGSISSSDVNGTSSEEGAGYLDRTLAHELTHAAQLALVGELPSFFAEGMAELTAGIDDEREESIRYLAGNSSALQNYTSSALTNYSTLESTAYAAAYMFFRYLAKQGADNYSASNSNSSGSSNSSSGSSSNSSSNASLTSDSVGLSFTGSLAPGRNYVSIDSSSNISVTSSDNYNATIIINPSSKLGNFSINSSDSTSYNLEFEAGTEISIWNITTGAGNDIIEVGDINAGGIHSGAGNDYIEIGNDLNGNIAITSGTGVDYFHADTDTVESSSGRHAITLTDIDFNAGDVVLVDAGVANLTRYFFYGNAMFYNYASASDASTSSTSGRFPHSYYSATNLIRDNGMTFCMARMADTSSPANSTAVVWANSTAANIDFSSSQTEAVLVFTNTNYTRADKVSLGGNFNDTIHAGANDIICAGGGNDQIYIDDSSAVTIGYSEGDGNDIVYNFSNDDVFSITSDSSYSSIESGKNLILTIGDNNVTLVGSSYSQTFNIQTTSRYYDVASDSLWGNSDSRESDLLSLTSSDLPENFVTVDDVAGEFVSEGLVLSMNDNSSLNLMDSSSFSIASTSQDLF